MGLLWILIAVLVIWGVVTLIRSGREEGRGGERSTALEILEERYARGEIDREEFEQRRSDLQR